MQPPGRAESGQDSEFDRLVDLRSLSTVFQPVVDLETGQTVAYEALTRGPEGSPFGRPDVLFEHAYAVGRADELDWVCRAAAFRHAQAAELPRGTILFVNVEPLSLRTRCPDDLREAIMAGTERYFVILELTERALAHDPAAVLHAVRQARKDGLGIAIDDVGAVPASLAMMPLLHPDVIKLDLSLVQSQAGPVQAQIVNAVLAETERTGAVILAEGIESPAHAHAARAMGAVLGQGWHYGGPERRPVAPVGPPARAVPRLDVDTAAHRTPFEVISKVREPHPASPQLLLSLSRRIEHKAADPSEPAVLLAGFQHDRNFDRRTRDRYARAATRATMVAVLGVAMDHQPAEGVRGTALHGDDPLAHEWVVIVVGPHFSAALVAVELPRDDPATPRQFRYAITHDRELVIAAARPLLQRMRPLSTASPHNDPFWTD
jgi:EAL domain-containing protein (putative c-di-GMP-specific phosphodiesterase class I)